MSVEAWLFVVLGVATLGCQLFVVVCVCFHTEMHCKDFVSCAVNFIHALSLRVRAGCVDGIFMIFLQDVSFSRRLRQVA